MDDITNEDRASNALTALVEYAEAKGVILHEEGIETVMTDLVADMMHLAKREGIDFADCATVAVGHYQAELDEGLMFDGWTISQLEAEMQRLNLKLPAQGDMEDADYEQEMRYLLRSSVGA
jgi:predicted subunit of tRNA(5-methylaminomethyl-2-thiouridylate) methyltransferase